MHKFLFGNTRVNNSSYCPFGSQKCLKPGIINKIKNKIQDLFIPRINSQSIIQRIQPFEDQNIEQELSNQFKKNLVLVERIIPNNEDNMTLKRKSICSFEQYLKEELDTAKKLSKETQNDLSGKTNHCQIKTSNAKKQKKSQKDHSKIYKDRKMEENQKQLEFNLNKQNFKQNQVEKKENSSENLSNCSNKRLKQFDINKENNIQFKQQKDQKTSINIFENQEIIQNEDNKNQMSDLLLKRLKTSSSSVHSPSNKEFVQDNINMDKKLSSSTGINTKIEANDTLLSLKNGDFQQEIQYNMQNLDNNIKPQIQKQNSEYGFQNIQISNEYNIKDCHQKQLEFKQDNSMVIQKQDCINQNNTEQHDNKRENQLFQKSEQSKLIFSQIEGNKDMMLKVKQDVELKKHNNLIQQDLEQFENVNLSNIQIKNSKQTQLIQNKKNEQKLDKQKEKINSQVYLQEDQLLKKKISSQIDKQDHLNEKEQQFNNVQNEQNKEISKNILQTSFLNNQNKQILEKNEKSIKEYNPFLILSPNISSDQISLYFQGTSTQNQNKEYQAQNQNQPLIDLFKISTQQSSSQQIINKTQDKQNTQNLQSIFNVNNFANQKILPFSTNKQMEIIQQVPQITPIIQHQSYNFESVKLNYQQQSTQQNNLFQQQQQQQQQHYYSEQLMQQSNYQIQNLFSQQPQTSNVVSSLNLFQSNPYQQQQNDQINQPFYFKNDVLSLFQDTKKSDRDIFQTQTYHQATQSLNNSFNKGRKKQRINNF
ncbi:unnamed protein product [Paramecium pentaurelia]|uniref:Uncharacterized protein n=1 Tax=Paramecium pentaurelia TaxID=43138 RepID=A0A8S1UH19_9CILI|nr:unnamed protein product [Paramecium pentaurelia]